MKVQMVDGQDIELYIYEPHADIRTRGVIQLVHGSCEHAGRYEAFINYLTDKGYIVYANDHRGHGKSVSSPEDYGYFGEEDGWQMMVDDLKSINDLIHAHNPELPIVMLGHSMGSFLARHYAIDYGETINGLILSGTAHNPKFLLKIGQFVSRLAKRYQGSKHRNKLINQLSYGTFNRNLPNAKTASDWICYDEEVVREFVADSSCGFIFTNAGFYDLFTGLLYITDDKNIEKMPHDLPVLFISGEDDPVGEEGKMVKKAFHAMQKAQLINVQIKLYPQMLHEILNEKNKLEVYEVTSYRY
ncbi:alpha/beta fold hydrolase, partial [Turicibacter sanguinis]|nr:alpha/beta fold hydrolase [Turicibacter sanguinis]